MTERGEINHNGKPATPSISSRDLAQRFTTAIADFNWKTDYIKFCQLLELEPGYYADEQYLLFHQLAEALTWFDAESLGKMIDAGEGNG